MSLDDAIDVLDEISTVPVRGKVTEQIGLLVKATAPGAKVGELIEIERKDREPLLAEVVGFSGDEVNALPLGSVTGLGPDATVRALGRTLMVDCSDALLGRVLDALGTPIDGGARVDAAQSRPVDNVAPSPLARTRIMTVLPTGIRVLDGLVTIGRGQRVGIFAGPGAGKSTLLGELARHAAVDVIVVALVGERGREVREFLETQLDPATRAKTVCLCATADAPPLLRLRCAATATAVAEYFRDQGKQVLLLVDSLTRVARAMREVALAAGEPPARQGFPASVFAQLPRLLERAGTADKGAITGVYTVLTSADAADDPIAEEVKATLDGHITLSAELAAAGQHPAVDVLRSLSRVMDAVTTPEHQAIAARIRALMAAHERHRDLIVMGAYRQGSDARTDEAIVMLPKLQAVLRQSRGAPETLSNTLAKLRAL